MCFDTIIMKDCFNPAYETKGVIKMFTTPNKQSTVLYGLYYSQDGTDAFDAPPYKRGVWLEARDVPIFVDPLADVPPHRHDGRRTYRSGFHGYLGNAPPHFACDGVLVKVRFRQLRALGTQDGYTVVVAGEMFIPKAKKPKAPAKPKSKAVKPKRKTKRR